MNKKLFKKIPEHDLYQCPRCKEKTTSDNFFEVVGNWNSGLCVYCGTEPKLMQERMKNGGNKLSWRELDERIGNNS